MNAMLCSAGRCWLPCCVMLFAVSAVLASQEGAKDKYGPETVILSELENEYEPVPFSHAAHARMAEMSEGCTTCHHSPPDPGAAVEPFEANRNQHDAGKIPACKSCHPVQAGADGLRKPGLKGAYHRQCLNCHKGWSGENGCEICHAPKDKPGPKAAPTPGDIVGRMHPPIERPREKLYTARYSPAAGNLVTFRHDAHIERYGITCASCHRRDSCANCHHEPNAGPARQPLLKPAMSWAQSHDPCLGCHQNQSCTHCHHTEDQPAPPAFDHALTGQTLDKDHLSLTCVQCHDGWKFDVAPTCGDKTCHGEGKVVRFPDHRPGEQLTAAPPGPVASWASLRPRPLRPVAMADKTRLSPAPAPEIVASRDARRHQQAKPPAIPPGQTASCVTAECHVAVKAYKRLHGPVPVNACDACHRLVDEKEHRFELLRQGEAICTYCHEFDLTRMEHVHEPVKRGECLGCHNPHGGPDRGLTREASIDQTCARCHEPVLAMLGFQHTPIREGLCTSCHAPHGAKLPNLLEMQGTDLCLACHDSFAGQIADARYTHDAMKEQCQRCHHPHGSALPQSLTAAPPDLCYACHQAIQKRVSDSPVRHTTAMATEQSCLRCHTAHGGDLARLMREQPVKLCLDCHSEPVKTTAGMIIAALPELADPDLQRHGPIAEGQCGGCHDVHGGSLADLLTAPYEPDLYRQSIGQETFCFQCHDRRLLAESDEGQTPATAFRNGTLNLHRLHAIGAGAPRNCTACHATHTASAPRLFGPP